MRTTSLLIGLLIIALGFSACEKDKAKMVEEIGYGTSFGMCLGYCVNEVAISTDKITFRKKKNGDAPETKTCTKNITEGELNELKLLVATNEFNKLPETIGCSDCADGGAEWISLKLEGKVKKVTFEYGKAPDELKALVQKLREIKEGFADCN